MKLEYTIMHNPYVFRTFLYLPLRVNLRYLLGCGMMLSAVMVFLFGSVGPWLKVYSVYYYGVFWGLNGEQIVSVTDHNIIFVHWCGWCLYV